MNNADRFVRGARVKSDAAEKPLTLLEALFVTCTLAEQNGICTEPQFVEMTRRMWRNYVKVSKQDGQSPNIQSDADKPARFTVQAGSLGVVKVKDGDGGYSAALTVTGDFPSDAEQLSYAEAVVRALNQAEMPR